VPHLKPASGAPAPTHTALIAPVPAAEPVVAELRRRLDAAAAWGVPAHVTVLYPFIDPAEVDERVIALVAEAMAPVPAFECSFARSRWFGQDVLWLDPEPARPFRDLTTAVSTAFPEHPPYGGAHDDVVPHLTVAERRLADLPAVQAAEHAVQAGLPVTTRIDRVLLMAGAEADSSWRVLHQFTLASTGDPAH
jgi:2'-5' RNA ligase